MKILTDHHRGGRACVISIHGDIDMVTVPEVQAALESVMNRGCLNIVLDLKKVSYMDSSALGLLVWADRALQPKDGALILAGADRNVSRILEISGLVSAAPTLSAAEDAADALSGLELSDTPDEPLWVREMAFPAHSASLARMRADVCELLKPLEITESTSFDIRVAVGEALSNAIRHGSPRGEDDAVSVTVAAYDDRVVLVVQDSGAGFDGESSSNEDPYASSGRGVMFMRALMDHVEFSQLPDGGTAVTLVRHLAKTTA